MKLKRGFLLLSLFGAFGVAVAGGQALVQETIPNWPAPETWTPTRASGVHTMSNITSPLPFIGVTPCRVADTRGNGFTGAYGPPSLVANATRSFTITGQCGIPASAAAVSFNFGALNVGGAGDLRVFPAGGSVPLVSTLNYNANTPNIANAAIVPLGTVGTGGAITVQADAVSIDLIIDLNGYYAPAGAGTDNLFLGLNAGNFAMTGHDNVGIGAFALNSNTTGFDNTAIGTAALRSNTTGFANTAIGLDALQDNTGSNNMAIGAFALDHNTSGIQNTALGVTALFSNNTGIDNTAIGVGTLSSNTTGSYNTALGNFALDTSTGSNNIAVGREAGFNLTIGDNNIDIGTFQRGVAGEAATIRIGVQGTQTATFISGISGAAVSGAAVLIDGTTGQLGVAPSAARFKETVQDMGDASRDLMKLRPVTFRYKPELDPKALRQYGLVAEEVAGIFPDLVLCDKVGQPETIRYQSLIPMLINEVQKLHLVVEEQRERIKLLEMHVTAPERQRGGWRRDTSD